MNRRSHLARIVLVTLLPALVAALAAGCGPGAKTGVLYHCPMHPTYVSDHPGDCPICNMSLVPVEESVGAGSPPATGGTAPAAAAAARYHCPMHPTYVSDRPGKCPICHMDLVPIEPGPGEGAVVSTPAGYSVIHVSGEARALAGVRTVVAVRDRLDRTVRAVGTVKPDETRLHQVNTRVSGWVRSLAVSFTGQFVREGDPLLTVYSPELVASQDEYLRAREAARQIDPSGLSEARDAADALTAAARERLLLLDVPVSLVRRIEGTGVPEHDVTLEAPATGYVTGKDIQAGARVEPGMTLFVVADLSRVWVEADVYEYEASDVSTGGEAVVTLPYDPAFRREARISYVYPTLDPVTRTLRVRVELPNPDLSLRPGMYANVEIPTGAAEGVVIPDDAILDSGTRRIVFVETAPGTFEPREVTVGMRGDGKVLILQGLSAGESVVVGANFLLDSESRLRAAIRGSAAEGTADGTAAGHGGHP